MASGGGGAATLWSREGELRRWCWCFAFSLFQGAKDQGSPQVAITMGVTDIEGGLWTDWL